MKMLKDLSVAELRDLIKHAVPVANPSPIVSSILTHDEAAELLANDDVRAYLAIYEDGGFPTDENDLTHAAWMLHIAGYSS